MEAAGHVIKSRVHLSASQVLLASTNQKVFSAGVVTSAIGTCASSA